MKDYSFIVISLVFLFFALMVLCMSSILGDTIQTTNAIIFCGFSSIIFALLYIAKILDERLK